MDGGGLDTGLASLALMALATQLGLFLQRAESEDRLRESEEPPVWHLAQAAE